MNDRFAASQKKFFEQADARHFWWQTKNPYVARTEQDLLTGIAASSHMRFLEVGCGEGGNIVNMLFVRSGGPDSRGDEEKVAPSVVGLDLFHRKLAFARAEGVPARFVCGDAIHLPFLDLSFDVVLCRDVLHHVSEPERVLAELHRVCRKGGTIWIIEPNGTNPLIRALALARPHERGLLRNSMASLQNVVSKEFPRARFEPRQPFPIHRLLLHYQFGVPRLGRSRAFARLMDAWARVMQAVLPRPLWAYLVIRADV